MENLLSIVEQEISEIAADDLNEKDIHILGFALNKSEYLYNFVAFLDLQYTFDEIIAQRSRGAPGKWENKELSYINIVPQELTEAFSKSPRIGFSVLAVYWALKNIGRASWLSALVK